MHLILMLANSNKAGDAFTSPLIVMGSDGRMSRLPIELPLKKLFYSGRA